MVKSKEAYEALAVEAMKKAKARGCLMILIGGTDGTGTAMVMTPDDARIAPDALRGIADDIEKNMEEIQTTAKRVKLDGYQPDENGIMEDILRAGGKIPEA